MKTTIKFTLCALGLAVAASLTPLHAAPITILNNSFEAVVADGVSPPNWNGAVGFPGTYIWSGINNGGPAADGVRAVLGSTSSAFAAITQTTGHALVANELFTLTTAFGNRDAGTPFGGYWMRLVVTDGVTGHVVANTYSNSGGPGVGLWADQTLSWTGPSNLASLATISNGITGTTPDGFADISVGTWNVNVLVGGNFPGGANDANLQTGIDNVRLDVIPEPSTLAFLGLGALAMLRRRRALKA